MRALFCLLGISLSVCAIAQSAQNIRVQSPDGKILFSLQLSKGQPTYQVAYKDKTIVGSSPLGISFSDGDFSKAVRVGKTTYRDAVEDYDLVIGKASHIHDPFREARIPIQQTSTPKRIIDLVVRIFNDGVAFRYEFPKQEGWRSLELRDENTTFNLTGDPVLRTLFLSSYTTSHEGLYATLPWTSVREGTLMDMPTLFELPGNIFVAITEAALLDYAGMYLTKHNGVLTSKLSPLPGQSAIKVKADLPSRSPWRVLMISDRIGALIESAIITDLNEPSRIKDISWIKPGKTTFPWWNGNVVPDTLNAPGMNFVTAQHYIDFCSRNKIEYHSLVEYGLHQWYTDDGVSFMPGPHSDVTTPVPGLNMKEICDYGKRKGVGIRVWVHWVALYPRLDSAFALFEKWGLQGMMVDFMDRDDQEMVNIQTEILQKAAAHHLHIQFHGAYKPTGINRTYPNEYTREGTLNYEADKWNSQGISPDHDIMMPFTRGLAGSTDYHLGGFRAVPKEQFRAQYTRPLVLGTRCHMLAMYVVLENGLPMVADYPAAYESEPGFEFISEVPTTWDETKVLDAKVGEYIIIARRKNRDWYVGVITNHDARQFSISLNFLKKGTFKITVFSDATDALENPTHLVKESRQMTNNEEIRLSVVSGGGATVIIRPADER